MVKLLKIEFRKLLKNKIFWILLVMYLAVLALIFFGVQSFLDEVATDARKNSPIPIPKLSIYEFPGIWHSFTFLAGFTKMFLAILVIIFITNEFSYKTIRQNIITGLSRWEFINSKLLMIAVLALVSTLFILICGTILGMINTTEIGFDKYIGKMVFLLAHFLEIFSFLVFALFIGFLVKRSGIAIGVLFLYHFALIRYIVYKTPDEYDDLIPMHTSGDLVDVPNTALMKLFGVSFREYVAVSDVFITLGYTALFIGLIYFILRKRDL